MKLNPFSYLGVSAICSHHFVGRVLNQQSTILDLGANKGEFSRKVKSRFGARCFSVEANPELCKTWNTTNGSIINSAVSFQNGKLKFFIHPNSESSSIFKNAQDKTQITSVEVEAMTLESIMSKFGVAQVNLVKIDIEGAEVDLLMKTCDATIKKFQQVTVEFHDFAFPEITAKDVKCVRRRMHRLGFRSISFSRRNTDILFVNKYSKILNTYEYLWLAYIQKYIIGFHRIILRLLCQIRDRTS